MTETVLDIRGLSKTYPGRRGARANRAIDLHARAGEVVGLLGHNGAGKTTLVNQIVGLLLPDSGSVRVAGHDAIASPKDARRLVSIQAQANVPITGLSPRVAVNLVGRIRGGARRAVARRAQDLITALDLEPWAGKPAQDVSGGVARLTAFAMAAVVPGRLVILDEPTNDVDPVRRRLLWNQIRQLADDGAAVLLVTHNVREAESAVDHLVVLDEGAVIASGTPQELSEQAQRRRAVGTLHPEPPRPVTPGADPPAPKSPSSGQLSLEDVYLELVGHAGEAVPPAHVHEETPA